MFPQSFDSIKLFADEAVGALIAFQRFLRVRQFDHAHFVDLRFSGARPETLAIRS